MAHHPKEFVAPGDEFVGLPSFEQKALVGALPVLGEHLGQPLRPLGPLVHRDFVGSRVLLAKNLIFLGALTSEGAALGLGRLFGPRLVVGSASVGATLLARGRFFVAGGGALSFRRGGRAPRSTPSRWSSMPPRTS